MPSKPPRDDERMADQERVGARFRLVREELGWSQTEAARIMGKTSPSTFSAIERGVNGLDLLDAWYFARQSGYPLQFFVDPDFSRRAPAWPKTRLDWLNLAGGDERRADVHWTVDRTLPALSNK